MKVETTISQDIIDYVKGVYCYVKSISPEGLVEEAFRLPPNYTPNQELLLHSIESN